MPERAPRFVMVQRVPTLIEPAPTRTQWRKLATAVYVMGCFFLGAAIVFVGAWVWRAHASTSRSAPPVAPKAPVIHVAPQPLPPQPTITPPVQPPRRRRAASQPAPTEAPPASSAPEAPAATPAAEPVGTWL